MHIYVCFVYPVRILTCIELCARLRKRWIGLRFKIFVLRFFFPSLGVAFCPLERWDLEVPSLDFSYYQSPSFLSCLFRSAEPRPAYYLLPSWDFFQRSNKEKMFHSFNANLPGIVFFNVHLRYLKIRLVSALWKWSYNTFIVYVCMFVHFECFCFSMTSFFLFGVK